MIVSNKIFISKVKISQMQDEMILLKINLIKTLGIKKLKEIKETKEDLKISNRRK